MIDKDDSGSLDKAEVVRAVQSDKKVINFLINCGNENLQYLLVPARLEMALNTLDTDRDGEINMPEWESAIETALANKLEARAADREKKAKAAQKEIAEFTAEFLNAARKCFQMIDKDDSGTLTKTEIVKAVAEDKEVVKFLRMTAAKTRFRPGSSGADARDGRDAHNAPSPGRPSHDGLDCAFAPVPPLLGDLARFSSEQIVGGASTQCFARRFE